jgi:5'-nucleotidase
MLNRRVFLRQTALSAGALVAGSMVNDVEAAEPIERLTILHTNDVHSRLEPFPMDGSKNQGLGGVATRAALINQIRKEQEHVLLLDAGDIFQGTPFFNIYRGEPEMKAMAAMGYDAATMGNHDFDGGIENFATQLQHANFPIIINNYSFEGTPMESNYSPYKTFSKGKIKIGITGVGIALKGLVPDNLYGNTKYLDPVQQVNTVAHHLRYKENCDMVICLSHLGYKYNDNTISDQILAKETENIDLIIGGHTHTFLDAPVVLKNKKGSDVIVNQVGWAGIVLGRLDFTFLRNRKKNLDGAHTVIIGKKASE